jgi:hypothetical protein
MKMIGSLRRMFQSYPFLDIYSRANAGNRAFFLEQYAPLEALAATHSGMRLVAMRQIEQPDDLDADFALAVEKAARLKVVITEVGDSIDGTKTHFLVAVDPMADGFAVRQGNFGTIDLPLAPFADTAWRLAQTVLAHLQP